MFRLLVVTSLVACCFGGVLNGRRVPTLDGRIVGGEEVSIKEVPWQVSLQYIGRHFCGGAIVDETTIFTAAHCLEGKEAYLQYLKVRVGSSFHFQEGKLVEVSSITIHPQYDSRTIAYDFGIIKLASPLEFSQSVQAIPVTAQDEPIVAGAEVLITGWGALSENGPSPKTLQKLTVPVVDQEQCNIAYSGMITDQMFCAGVPEGGRDACQGDSGGPVVRDGQLVGIVSWGFGCARPKMPGVYSRIAVARNWFDESK